MLNKIFFINDILFHEHVEPTKYRSSEKNKLYLRTYNPTANLTKDWVRKTLRTKYNKKRYTSYFDYD